MERKRRSDINNPEPVRMTAALRELGRGHRDVSPAAQSLLEVELRRLAAAWMRRERKGHTLCPTALVNEAYLRLFGRKNTHWNDRMHFLADASRVMRRLLVDYARRRQVRAPEGLSVPLDSYPICVETVTMQALEIDLALEALAAVAPRQALLVELRFFGGCSLEEAAAAMRVSPRTADKDWLLARAWLKNHLDGGR